MYYLLIDNCLYSSRSLVEKLGNGENVYLCLLLNFHVTPGNFTGNLIEQVISLQLTKSNQEENFAT
jgi:hypothetical protein